MNRQSLRSQGKSARSSPHTRQADILANAMINDSPAVMGIDQLSPAIQADIITARLKGYQPVSVRWITGEFALMFCEPGTNMPRPERSWRRTTNAVKQTKLFLKEYCHEHTHPRTRLDRQQYVPGHP